MGTQLTGDTASAPPARAGNYLLLAGGVLAMLPFFSSFLPVDLGVLHRLEPMGMVLHLAAGFCAVGLVVSFVQARELTVHALSHPMVLAAFLVAGWSVLVSPLVEYPLLSMLGSPEIGDAAIRYASLGVLFAAAHILARDERCFRSLLVILLAVSVCTPIAAFAWAQSFFVTLDLVGHFAISGGVAAWLLLAGRQLAIRLLIAGVAALPAFALSGSHSIVLVLLLVALPAAVLAHFLMRRGGIVGVRRLRWCAVAATVATPFVGLLLKWLLPDLINLPSIQSRHLLDRVLFAAMVDNPLILLIGQGWGAVNLTFDNFVLAAGAVMWDGSWDLANRNVTHSHSVQLEALFGAGLPAFAGVLAMIAAPILAAPRERLPLVVFVSLAFAGAGALTGELPSTAGALALAFALACAPMPDAVGGQRLRKAGRALAFAMPVVAAGLLAATAWQFHRADTIRERVADARMHGVVDLPSCELHPHTAHYADTQLSQGFIKISRRLLHRAATGRFITEEEFRLLDAYTCSVELRADSSNSPSLHLAAETFRKDMALSAEAGRLPARYRQVLNDWPAKMVRVLNAAPQRSDAAIGFFAAQLQRGNFRTVSSLSGALLSRRPDDPVGLWFNGLAKVRAGDAAAQAEGRQQMRHALENGLLNVIDIPQDTIDELARPPATAE